MSNVKSLELPKWYPLPIYEEIQIDNAELWLYEIYKRVRFLPVVENSTLTLEQKINEFYKIFENNIEDFLKNLIPKRSVPIKPLSVTDVLRLASLIKKSNWYKSNLDKDLLEDSIEILANDGTLSEEHKIVLAKYYDTSWHIFHGNSIDEDWLPNQDFTYLSGIPISIDPSYYKDEVADEIKRLMKNWVGCPKGITNRFVSWYGSKIFAIFDLCMWFKIIGSNYNKITIHNLVWEQGRRGYSSKEKSDTVNPYDSIDGIMELVKDAISPSTMRSLWLMCEGRKYQQELVVKNK